MLPCLCVYSSICLSVRELKNTVASRLGVKLWVSLRSRAPHTVWRKQNANCKVERLPNSFQNHLPHGLDWPHSRSGKSDSSSFSSFLSTVNPAHIQDITSARYHSNEHVVAAAEHEKTTVRERNSYQREKRSRVKGRNYSPAAGQLSCPLVLQ